MTTGYWGGFENSATFQLWRKSIAYRSIFQRVKEAYPYNAAKAQYICENDFNMPAAMLEGVNWQEIAKGWNTL